MLLALFGISKEDHTFYELIASGMKTYYMLPKPFSYTLSRLSLLLHLNAAVMYENSTNYVRLKGERYIFGFPVQNDRPKIYLFDAILNT